MARILAFISGVYELDYTDLRLPDTPKRIVINQAVAVFITVGLRQDMR